jgi:hypothetical protein
MQVYYWGNTVCIYDLNSSLRREWENSEKNTPTFSLQLRKSLQILVQYSTSTSKKTSFALKEIVIVLN